MDASVKVAEVRAGRGAGWLAEAFGSFFRKAPMAWIGLSAGWLIIMLAWLSGRGWPRRTSAFRRFHCRLWRPEPGAWSGENLISILGLIGAMIGLSEAYVLIGASRPPVDVSPYPTTAIRFSILLMGPAVAGIVVVVGKPNAGKSTLLNHCIGEHLSITTSKRRLPGWMFLNSAKRRSTSYVPGVRLSKRYSETFCLRSR